MSNQVTRVVLTGRCSYPHLLKPHSSNPEYAEKYSVEVILEPDTDLGQLKASCDEAMVKKAGKILPCKLPLVKGDDVNEKRAMQGKDPRPEIVGKYILRAKSDDKPLVVDAANQDVMDEETIYAGCYVQVNVTPFYYSFAGNVGLSTALNGVRFYKDGDRLGNAPASANDLFGGGTAAAPATDYSNLI